MREADADEAVRVVVLTGTGRAFSAGADLSQGGLGRGPKARWETFETNNARQFALWSMRKPVLAAVHGWCLGRGCELALWCDVVIASEDARIGRRRSATARSWRRSSRGSSACSGPSCSCGSGSRCPPAKPSASGWSRASSRRAPRSRRRCGWRT